jgi:hypothetical protein
MILGSHNSWSFLRFKKWWMRLLSFTARCQECSIKDQYNIYGVRCFDLRIKFAKNGKPIFSHGAFVYDYSLGQVMSDLFSLDLKGDCYVRVLHEARKKKEYTEKSKKLFIAFSKEIESKYPNIKFWCGKNLYNWKTDYEFKYNPSCEEKYASVCPPKIIDDWYPKMFAKRHNQEIKEKGTDCDILLIDFVDL